MDDTELISDIRAFTRFYTPLIGALDAGHLRTPYSLAEARVIYELARRGRASPGELSTALHIDPGYLTRIHWRLSDLGLTATLPNEKDRRSNILTLTAEGEAAFAAPSPQGIDLRSELVRGCEFAAALPVGSDEIRVAEGALRGCPVLLPSRPQVAPRKAQEHRPAPRLHTLPLERQERFLDRIPSTACGRGSARRRRAG